MFNIFLVGTGGFLGAISRYGTGIFFMRALPSGFPMATFTVNIVGSFLMGILASQVAAGNITDKTALLLGTGFLGAFTTFSTFSIESFHLYSSGEYSKAALNVLVNPLGAVFAAVLGFKLFVNT